jgi:hypothetical protein
MKFANEWKCRWRKTICVGCSFPELSTKNTRNIMLLCFSYGVAFSSISTMVSASATYMNTPLQLSQVSFHFQFLALFVFYAEPHIVFSPFLLLLIHAFGVDFHDHVSDSMV